MFDHSPHSSHCLRTFPDLTRPALSSSILTVSVFELIDRALDHLYTVNNVLPDTVDDEVTQELGNAIEVCEKIYNEFKPREVEE